MGKRNLNGGEQTQDQRNKIEPLHTFIPKTGHRKHPLAYQLVKGRGKKWKNGKRRYPYWKKKTYIKGQEQN